MKTQKYSSYLLLNRIIRTCVCILLCVLSLFPFYIMIVNATLSSEQIKAGIHLLPGGLFKTNFDMLMDKASGTTPIWRTMLNSLTIAVPTTVFSVYFSAMTAYGIHTYRFVGRKAVWTFILAIMMVPAQVSILGFYQFMLQINLDDTYWPLIIPSIAAPTIVFFMRQYMQSALSLEIVESSRIDGAGEFRTFNTIVTPMLLPAIATQAIFQFIAAWNNLFVPSIILTSPDKITLPMSIQMFRSEQFKTDFGVVYMGLFITVIPIFIVYFILSKYIIEGVALGGVKE
ncbi:MAG: carbohydrate ABC transporter permease [Oscillospiraceae bacterium]